LDNQNPAKIYLVFVDFIWFSLNSFMRTHGQQLQAAYRQHIAPYSEHLQFAVTLTLKQSAQIVTPYANGEGVYKRFEKLDDEKLASSIRYFNSLLRHELYGNKCWHKNKQHWAPEFDSLKAKWLIFMGLTSKRSITDWCSGRLRWVF
jgi:hypothetical protein